MSIKVRDWVRAGLAWACDGVDKSEEIGKPGQPRGWPKPNLSVDSGLLFLRQDAKIDVTI